MKPAVAPIIQSLRCSQRQEGRKERQDSRRCIYSTCTVLNYICLIRKMALRSFFVLEIRMC